MRLGLTASPAYMPWRLRDRPQPDSWQALSSDRVRAELDLVAGLGLRLVRFELPWALVEPRPGLRRWDPVDTIVAGCLDRGLAPVPILIWTPSWAADEPNQPPRDLGRLRDFALAAAGRYRRCVGHWEIWNEPNLARYWAASLSEYAAGVLEVAAGAVREAAPGARVLLAGLSQGGGLGEVLAAARRGSFDVANLHYYPAGRMAGWRGRPQVAVNAFRRTLQAWNLGRVPVWLSEVGADAAPRAQASVLRRTLRHANVDAVLWYTLRDHQVHEAAGPVKQTRWGLFDAGLRPRPAAGLLLRQRRSEASSAGTSTRFS